MTFSSASALIGEIFLKTAFICCEYNPFHNGHKYHIEETRKQNIDTVICIMSGNFMQRGSIALFDKHTRALCAVESGADIVIELPVKYAISTASLFAEGFIKTVQATGIDGIISFACNSNSEDLTKLSDFLAKNANTADLQNKQNTSYPSAVTQFVFDNLGEDMSKILRDSNSTLALEYLKSLKSLCNSQQHICIERIGAQHNSTETYGNFASAEYIRNILSDSEDKLSAIYSVKRFIPEISFNCISNCIKEGKYTVKQNFDKLFYSRLLYLNADDFGKINNVSGGLENRIAECIKSSSTIDELCDKIKSKRYTHSRIRQIITSSVLGVQKSDYEIPLGYIRVLACNSHGREVIKKMKTTAQIPVIMNLSEIKKSDNITIQKQAQLDYLTGKLFDLSLYNSVGGNPEYSTAPIIIE